MAKEPRPRGKAAAKLYATDAIVPQRDAPKAKQRASGDEPRGTASDTLDEIARYDKAYGKWEKRGAEIVARYRDERDQTVVNSPRAFNILWSNVQVLKPTLYAHAPKAEVERRYKDSDPVARVSCEVAERATDYEIEAARLDAAIQQCVQDRLLPGRGQVWVTYKPTLKGDKPDAKAAKDGAKDERVKSDETLCVDYVPWKDFGHSLVAHWGLVTKVWRWKWFDREDFIAQFGEDYVDRVAFAEKKDDNDKSEGESKTAVAEVWDKDTGTVCWVSKAVSEYLDEYDAPLALRDFFPCPPPLYATLTNDTLVPVPDFYLYQDQANEVDKLTGRINRLTDALRVTGAYDKTFPELQDILSATGKDNDLIGVSMTDLTGKGGMEAVIQLVDISKVVETLQACYIARDQARQVIYEITGVSDILRGSTDPNETLGAQQLKAQFGGTRISDMRQEVARFARDAIRIMAEIIVEMYDPVKLWEMTNAESFVGTVPAQAPAPPMPGMPPQPPPKPMPNYPLFVQAVKLLKDDKLRSYRVDIETDSTIALDEAQSKQEATEYISAISGVMEKAIPMASAVPATIPFLVESLLFVARRFKAGRSLEGALEQMGQSLAQGSQQQKPDPEMAKVQAQMALEEKKAQHSMQLKQQQAQLDAQLQQDKAQRDSQHEAMQAQADMATQQQKAQLEMALMREEAALKLHLAERESQAKTDVALVQAAAKARAQKMTAGGKRATH